MAPFPLPNSSAHVLNESPRPSLYDHRQKSQSEEQRDKARIIFNKTIEGHHRHGKNGYRQVGALFLTWKDDDMQCRETEVDKLRQLFAKEFNFKTVNFEIPSQRWETALHKAVADFCYEYDSPEDLAIIYYAGHAYEGSETKHFKLAAKFENVEGEADPSAFFPDVLTCLRLPACDQLVILDCCYAALAFRREHIGKRKFELLTSAAHDRTSPAPKYSDISFTTALTKALRSLLKQNPKGFCTGRLYREVYHDIPERRNTTTTKPLLFDQSPHNLGKIWLMPQVLGDRPLKSEGERYLKLTFRLDQDPNLAVMNELAKNLQYLPHVEQIRFEDLSAPREQILNFMKTIVQAKKIKPLIRKIQAKRKRQVLADLQTGDKKIEASKSLLRLHFEQHHHSIYDWDRVERVTGHQTADAEESRGKRKKTGTWPPALENSSINDSSSEDTYSTLDLPGPGTIFTTFVPRRANTIDVSARKQTNSRFRYLSNRSPEGVVKLSERAGITPSTTADQVQTRDGRKRQRSPLSDREIPPEKRVHNVD